MGYKRVECLNSRKIDYLASRCMRPASLSAGEIFDAKAESIRGTSSTSALCH